MSRLAMGDGLWWRDDHHTANQKNGKENSILKDKTVAESTPYW